MIEKNLKKLLKTSNLSVTELAQRTGVPRTNIQQWLSGTSPNIVQVDKVANYFGITIDELVFDRRPKSSVDGQLFETLIHSGDYKIMITKIVKKDEE